jgi:hypothetical protein
MCVTVNKYSEIIGLLEDTIYPSLNALFLELDSNIDPTHNDENVTYLKKEFASLELFERKLIFPSIVSIFYKSSNEHYAPNIADIIRLTKSKEEKIKQLIAFIKDCMQQKECSICSSDNKTRASLDSLIYSIENNYIPLKNRWIKLLEELNPEKANCKNRELGKCKCGKEDALLESLKAVGLEENLHQH